MITKEMIEEANNAIQKVPYGKGGKTKDYATVNSRVNAFRLICPDASITTEIVHMDDKAVVMKSSIMVDDKVVATGLAREVEGDGFVNKTSHIENCETSAVGRALGFLGIGSDESISSADELANALRQQELKAEKANPTEISVIKNVCKKKGKSFSSWCKQLNKTEEELTAEDAGKMLRTLNSLPDKEEA